MTQPSPALFNRRCELVVSELPTTPGGAEPGQNLPGLDLSQFRIQFEVGQSDFETPNNVWIRVWNLAEATARTVQDQYGFVLLSAGYVDGPFATIFRGSIKEVRRGKLSPTDTFTDIYAADGDTNYVFGFANQAFGRGATPQQQLDAYRQALGGPTNGLNARYAPGVVTAPAVPLPRSKVGFGMARARLRNLAAGQQWTWSLVDGSLVAINFQGYLDTEAIVLNSATGLVGMPVQTPGGVEATSLLNPKAQIGGLVQIDEKSVIPAPINLQFAAINALPQIAADGFYRGYVIEHEGDTRGNPWYTHFTCLAVDPTVAPPVSVKPYG